MNSDDPALRRTETSAAGEGLGFARTVSQDMDAQAGATAPQPAGASRYIIEQVIGEGGMGRVLQARDAQFSRAVALKQLHRERSGKSARERFALEAMVTGNLEHPGVPTVYERGTLSDGSPFYAMRLVQGRTFAQAIADAPDIARRLKLVPVIIKVAQTIGFAHERGIIDRDIKPDNIIVGRYGEAVVLDWGIAKVRGLDRSRDGIDGRGVATGPGSSSQTRHGSVVGTPAYMAPEQAAGRVDAIDERTDVFALGGLLYHLLTGHAPYDGPDTEAVIARALKAEVQPLTTASGAPPGMREICAKAMALAPDDRYQTASEVADALENFTARAVAGVESRTLVWVTNAIAIAGLLGAAASVFFTWSSVATLREQGWTGIVVLAFAAAGCILSVIEWTSRGRYRLSALTLAFALGTLFVGVTGASADVEAVLRFVSKPEILDDAARYRAVSTEGLYESLGVLSTAAILAVLQLLAWAIAARRLPQSAATSR